MRGFSFILFTVATYLGLFFAVQNGFGVTEISSPASAEVAGVSTTAPLLISGNPVIDLVNQARRDNGVKQLVADPGLSYASQLRATDMTTSNYYSHIDNQGNDYTSLLTIYKAFSCENLDLTDTAEPEKIVQDWLNSELGHRECMLDPRATNIGVASDEFTVNGNSDSSSYLTVLIISSN